MTEVPCAAVLFDCDGVLVDSDASVISAWTRWALNNDFVPDEVLAMVHGRRSTDTVALLMPPSKQAAAAAEIDRYEVEDSAAVSAIPGARELTEAIPAARWAVVTSGNSVLATARLRSAGIRIPSSLITADAVRRGKPDPEGYLAAARELGVLPADCVVLEDAVAGITAARAAGVNAVIGVGSRGLEGHADVVVTDLTSIRWGSSGLII
jgi:mannitol-1-/sugar-/sorbitol-6-phosphatase